MKKGQRTTYSKGPDVMSKPRRTVQCYAASWQGQTSLDNFNFGTTNLPKTVTPGGVASFKNAANGATPMTAVPHV